jgi:hypothetical protein
MFQQQMSDLTLPRLLYGPSMREAHKRWRDVARKAAKSRSWATALCDAEVMRLEDVKGDFACNNASALLFIGENLWIDDMLGILQDVCTQRVPDPGEWSAIMTDLVLSGLDHFWFALETCVTGSWLGESRDAGEKRRTAVMLLPKLLRWWPQICLFDHRFSQGQKTGNSLRGWPGWSAGLAHICLDLGVGRSNVDKLAATNPMAAANMASVWLDDSEIPE